MTEGNPCGTRQYTDPVIARSEAPKQSMFWFCALTPGSSQACGPRDDRRKSRLDDEGTKPPEALWPRPRCGGFHGMTAKVHSSRVKLFAQ